MCTQGLDFEKAEKYLEGRSYEISEVEMFDLKKNHTSRKSSSNV